FPNRIAVIGDPAQSNKERKRLLKKGETPLDQSLDVVIEAKRRLASVAQSVPPKLGWDMEPASVVRDMIREKFSDAVGGPLQVVKVYRHCNAQPFAVPWPQQKGGRVSLLGRPLMDFERYNAPLMDPDTFAMTGD